MVRGRKREGEKSGLRYLTRERLACWGRRGKERDGVRDEIERKGQFLNGIHGRCTCGSGAPGRTRAWCTAPAVVWLPGAEQHNMLPGVSFLSLSPILTARVEPRSHFDAVT